MADISYLGRLIAGATKNVDLASNALVVQSIKIGGGVNTELTKAILDNLITLQNGSDISASLHHHDGRYYTETELNAGQLDNRYFTEAELGAQTDGASGASKIGIDVTPAFSNFTSGNNVQSALEGIDAALASVAGADKFVKVSAADTTAGYLDGKTSAGSGLSKSITNPAGNEVLDFAVNVDGSTLEINANALRIKALGIDNSHISASAAIAQSKLSLSITNAEVNASAAIAESKLALDYSTSSLNSAIGTKANDADVIKKDGSVAFTGAQSMGGFKLTSLGAPTAASDAATKGYVDNALEGLKPKAAVRAASSSDVSIANGLEAGDSVGGVTLVAGDRVLLFGQSAPAENGIYVASASGAASRATDMDSLSPIDEINKSIVAVQEGTEAGKIFVQYGSVVTLGTDAINFTFFNSISGLVGGDGITVSGSNISVDHDGQGLQFVANQLALELDGSSLAKSASGLKIADSGVTNAMLAGSIADSKLNQITTANKVAGSAIQLSATPGLQDSTGLEIKLDPAGAMSKSASGVKSEVDDLTIKIVSNKLEAKQVPTVKKSFVAGEAFSANTLYVVRFAISGETAGRVYKADKDASSSVKYMAIGAIYSASSISAADPVEVTVLGEIAAAAAFSAGDIGLELFVGSAGAVIKAADLANTANEAAFCCGSIKDTGTMWVDFKQLRGIA